MNISDYIKLRSSSRLYTNKSVSRDVLRQLVALAQRAPSSCNLQLTQYIIVDDPKLLKKLTKISTKKFSWAPAYIIFVHDPRFTVEHNAAIVSLGASMQNILLAVQQFGLAACPMAGFRGDEEIKKLLGIPSKYKISLVMSVGYSVTAAETKEQERLPVDEVIHFNNFNAEHKLLNDRRQLDKWTIRELMDYRRRIAPVYLYSDHFRLGVYPDEIYHRAVEIFNERVLNKLSGGVKILDLISYDCQFARQIKENTARAHITLSDYSDYPGKVFQRMYVDSQFIKVNEDNELVGNSNKYHVITFVHKLSFTRHFEQLISSVVEALEIGGYLFVSNQQESLSVRARNFLAFFNRKYLKRGVVNVYEGSRYYKIGPHKQRKLRVMNNVLIKNNLSFIEGGTELIGGSTFEWVVWKKND